MAEPKSTKTKSAGGTRTRKTTSQAKRTAAARKGGKARGRQQTAQKGAAKAAKAATKPAAESAEVSAKTIAELREALRQNLIRPLDMMPVSYTHLTLPTNREV